jgi:uncharacterized protein YndB with AHSA1/START domain
MSCNIERSVELPASPDEVWEALPELFDDDDRARVVDEDDAPHRLSFWWTTVDGDEPPSYVEIDLSVSAVGTLLHIRETRLDGAALVRSAFNACAHAA